MLSAHRIVKFLLPAVMAVAVLSALGVASLVAEFTPPDRLVSVVWLVTIVVLVLIVAAVPLLYALARHATKLGGGEGEGEGRPGEDGMLRPQRSSLRVREARREHAVVVAIGIEGLPRLMEVLPPEAAAEAFNVVLQAIDNTVRAHGGVIERFLDRDALLVFRGEPFGLPPELAAARAALALAALVPELTVPGQNGNLRGLRFLAGLTAGSVMVAELRETGAKEPARLTVFSELTTQARGVLNAARNRGVNVLATTYVEARARNAFRMTAVGAINEMVAHQRVEVFVIEGALAAAEPALMRSRTS